MRERAKSDPDFCQRFIDYVSQVVEECIPDDLTPPEYLDSLDFQRAGGRVFQPFVDPNCQQFDELVNLDLSDIVRSRQMHKRVHMPTCFKYGSKKCRARFPRKIVPETSIDPETGILRIHRNHSWVNNYHKWIAIMTRANHDCQILFTRNHSLAIIHYVMKYITKPEAALHSKLTVAAAIRKAFAMTPSDSTDTGKLMLLKIYNKLDAYREVGVPEAISHMLGYPDHYTDATFVNIHTTHLCNYISRLSVRDPHRRVQDPDQPEAEILVGNNGRLSLCSLFDDYAHRGSIFASYCLYDYGRLVYKEKAASGVAFEIGHPQHTSHRQILRKSSDSIPTLLGRLLFLKKDSEKESEREAYYCILVGLFLPWASPQQIKPTDVEWEQFFNSQLHDFSPRLRRYIANLDLLHKTAEETRIDRLQRQSQELIEDPDEPALEVPDNYYNGMTFSDDEEFATDNIVPSSAVEEIIAQTLEPSGDYYAREGMDASEENGYFSVVDDGEMTDDQETLFSSMSLRSVKTSLESLCNSVASTSSLVSSGANSSHHLRVQPMVYLTDDTLQQAAIDQVIHQFSLNIDQARTFEIIANHTLRRGRNLQDQLLMGLFGEAGTGKSRVVDAIRSWFQRIGRETELVVTATTGVAAFNIRGTTLHSALGIAIEDCDNAVKMSNKKLSQWAAPRYLIIDEVSIMGAKLITTLHNKLCFAKSSPAGVNFGGINLIFLGDFLQLPSVSSYHLYTDKPLHQAGHHLWRSLNAVMILKIPMRQINDPRWAELLHRLRLRRPTQEDIDLIKSRIGAPVAHPETVPIIVRRNELRHKLNVKMVQLAAARLGVAVTYCLAHIKTRAGISLRSTYALRYGHKNVKGDAILPLVRGAPLMITTNVNLALGDPNYLSFS